MKILVTGGAGFIGSHVVDAYVQAGHEVVVIDDLSTGRREHLNPRARLVEMDIRSPAVSGLVTEVRPEVISHQAARAALRDSLEQPVLFAEVNLTGSLVLLEAARRHGVRRFIYASTGGAVYGEPQHLPVDEQHPVRPLDPYGASKHAVEHYLDIYERLFGLEFVNLRYPNVYGPRQDPFGEAGVVAIFSHRMLRGEEPVVNGSGEQERDYVYAGDIAWANLLALTKGAGRTFNLGSEVGTSVNTLWAHLAGLTGYRGERVHAPAKAGEVFKIRLTGAAARAGLGWEPRVALEEGLALTVAYFREAGARASP